MEAVLLPRAARRGALRVVPGILGMTGWHRAPQKILGVMGNCDGAHILVCMSVSGIFISWEKNTRRRIFTLSNLNLIRLVCYSSLRLAILLAKWLDPVPAHIGHVTRTPSEERWCTSSWTLGTQLSAKYDNIWLDGHLNYDLMCNQNPNVTCSSLRCITYLHNVNEETTEPINPKQYIFVHVPF